MIESGLKAGDKVIINGMRKIFFPGQPVNPRVVPMDQPDLPPPATQVGSCAGRLSGHGNAYRFLADLH